MSNNTEQARVRTPRGVLLLIVLLAATQPALLLWTSLAPPDGAIPTGLHIPDSALFLYSMRMVDTRLDTPYATCVSVSNDRGVHLYAVPHLWLYGLLGALARLIHANDLLLYALANGLGAFLYLWAVYRLLRLLVPTHANLAFFLFALSGGPAGVLYILTGLLDLHAQPQFDAYFLRFGVYELFEGPHLLPVTHLARFYYTLSLALLLGGATGLIRASREHSLFALAPWFVPMLCGAFINARFGLFVLALACLHLAMLQSVDKPFRLRLAIAFATPVFIGFVLSSLLMSQNPATVANHLHVANMAMWFSPFVCAAWLHMIIALRPILRGIGGLARAGRIAGGAALGYLAAFGILYVLHQAYHGNLLIGRDGSVAAAVSDKALLGAVIGGLIAGTLRPRTRLSLLDGFTLWFLLAAALAISGFGDGWFLKFGPQRLEVLIWLPLCVLATEGLREMRPCAAKLAAGAMLTFGVASISVALLCFQGPLGRGDARGPYPELHAEIISTHDARIMAQAWQGGTVLTTAPAADVYALRLGNPVVFGIGSFNLTDCHYTVLKNAVDRFFAPDTPDSERLDLVNRWQPLFVYCPDTWPVHENTIHALRSAPWLEEVASEGRAVLFRVRQQRNESDHS